MSGTGEEPIPGFPAIGQYEVVPGPGEPGYEPPEDIQIIDLNDPEAMQELHNAIVEAGGEPPIEADQHDPDEDFVESDEVEAAATEPNGDDEEPIDPDEDNPYDEE